MASKYEKSFVEMANDLDEAIRSTDNAHHKKILRNYRRHGLLEISQRWREFLIPSMTIEHPVYRMNNGTYDSMVLDGMEQVAGYYASLEKSGGIVLWPIEEKIAVADWGFASEAIFLHFMPGKMLASHGNKDIDDPEATYLVKHRVSMVWHYDEDARLIGEHVYEDSTSREITKPDPSDVISPAEARRLLEPVLENSP